MVFKKGKTIDIVLPKIDNPLVNIMPYSAIQAATKVVHPMQLESLQ